MTDNTNEVNRRIELTGDNDSYFDLFDRLCESAAKATLILRYDSGSLSATLWLEKAKAEFRYSHPYEAAKDLFWNLRHFGEPYSEIEELISRAMRDGRASFILKTEPKTERFKQPPQKKNTHGHSFCAPGLVEKWIDEHEAVAEI